MAAVALDMHRGVSCALVHILYNVDNMYSYLFRIALPSHIIVYGRACIWLTNKADFTKIMHGNVTAFGIVVQFQMLYRYVQYI